MIDQFIHHLRSYDRSESTVTAYVADLAAFSQWYLDHTDIPMEPAAVMSVDIREFKEHLLADGYKASSINRKLAALSTFFSWCHDSALVETDPTSTIRGVRIQSAPAPRWLTRKEQKALIRELQVSLMLASTPIAELRVQRDRAMVALMMWSGLRRSEVANAEMAKLEMNGRRGALRVIGKGQKERVVHLNADALGALRAWLNVRSTHPDAAGCRYLFLSQQGAGLTPKSVYRAVRKHAKRAGIHDLTPHSLRHTFGKSLVDKGVSLERIARLMGHDSVTTTAIYLEPSGADLDKAVELIAWTD